MPSDFVANGIDLDDIFAPYVSGVKADPTFLTVGGTDLKDRYQKYVSGAKAGITFFTDTGVDLKDIFAPIGGDPIVITYVPFRVNVYNGANGPGTVQGGTNASVSGGVGPFTYLWEYVSGSADIVIITSPTAEDATFSFTSASLAAVREAVWKLTVTDSLLATGFKDLNIKLQRGGEPE